MFLRLNDRDIYNGQGLNEEDIRSKSRVSTSFPNTERNTNNSVRFGGGLDDKTPSAIEIAVPQSISTEEQGNETHALSSKIDDDFEESHDWHRKGVRLFSYLFLGDLNSSYAIGLRGGLKLRVDDHCCTSCYSVTFYAFLLSSLSSNSTLNNLMHVY